MTLYVIGCILAGYLLGNFNGAILISDWIHGEDVRKKGSGNAGLTNFYRNYGSIDTLLVLLIDVGKTVLACFVGGWILGAYDPALVNLGNMICGGMAVIGHVFPVLFRFHGGKGILCCGTLAAFMDWRAIAILLLLFILLVILTKYVSLASVICCAVYPFVFWWRFQGNWVVVLLAFVVSFLAIDMHRENIARLIKGTERKFSFKRNTGGK